MLSVSYGNENRERRIRELFDEEPCTAVLLAAVHFEWTMKRAILKLGISPTKELRQRLERVYRITGRSDDNYKSVWKEQVSIQFRNSRLGTVLGTLSTIQNHTSKVRGLIIHGNGTVSREVAEEAMNQYLTASRKIFEFAKNHGEDLDSRLRPRRKARTVK